MNSVNRASTTGKPASRFFTVRMARLGMACLGLAVASHALAPAAWALQSPPGGGGDVTGKTDPAPTSPGGGGSGGSGGANNGGDTPARGPGGWVDLTPRFRMGDLTRYEFMVRSDQETTSAQNPDLDNKQQMTQQFWLALRVAETGNSGTTLELVTERVRMKIDGDAGKAAADSGVRPVDTPADAPKPRVNPNAPPGSTQPGSPQPARPGETPDDRDLRETLESTVVAMVGEKMTLTVDARGHIVSVKGSPGPAVGPALDSLGLGGLLGGLGGGLGGGGGGPGGVLSGALEWMVRGSSTQPDRVTTGQTWSNRDQLANTPLGGLRMATEYRVTSTRDQRAEIAFRGSMEPDTGGLPGQPPNLTTGLRLSGGTYTGTYTWDGVKGQIARMNATTDSSIEGDLLGSAVKSKAKSVMTLERIRVP